LDRQPVAVLELIHTPTLTRSAVPPVVDKIAQNYFIRNMQNIDLENGYRKEYVSGLIDRIRFWFAIRKIRREKQLIIWESNMDRMFFETKFADKLSFDEEGARKRLAAENGKPLAEQDRQVIADLEEDISMSKAIKQNYRKNKQFREEASSYINMIDEWLKI
jgi:hypothetical protein